ncbi:hypothetical protein [Saliphagus sp. LR7]|uniref:hypothetical protein n=1 Tax=Saliphagus sp. LR7 TaxID=2282654 RepID=UPI0013005AD6|nr:hypothetical protein [Saliphagus sp. LR7]
MSDTNETPEIRVEGSYTIDEFEAIWREINGSWDETKRITVVEFELHWPAPS